MHISCTINIKLCRKSHIFLTHVYLAPHLNIIKMFNILELDCLGYHAALFA